MQIIGNSLARWWSSRDTAHAFNSSLLCVMSAISLASFGSSTLGESAKTPPAGASKPLVKHLSKPSATVTTAVTKDAAVKVSAGYRLSQLSEYSGQFELVVSSAGWKMKNTRRGVTYLVYPKSDDLTVMNERAKTFCTVPSAKWKAPFSAGALVRGDQFIDLKVYKSEPVKEHGLKAEQKLLKTSRIFNRPAIDRDEKLTVVKAAITVTTAFPCERPAWKVASSLFGISEQGGYPLVETFVNRKNTEHLDLKLVYLKEEKIPSSEFEVPAAFKQVPDINQVYANSGDSDSFKDILEGF